MTWCKDSIGGVEIEYIRSDAFREQEKEIAELRAKLAALQVEANIIPAALTRAK